MNMYTVVDTAEQAVLYELAGRVRRHNSLRKTGLG
jgi:hypothetical protein